MNCSDSALKSWRVQLLLTACLGVNPVAAQLASGTVTDDAGNPVAGALVMFIEQETAGRSHVTATNDEGFYQIDLTAPTTIADESSALPG